MKIRGEWAFITGAAGGLGLAMANELAARGAKLILTDLAVASMQDAAEALRAGGTEVVVWAQDVTDRERWVEIADTLKAEGRIPRLLINNAGIITPERQSALDMDFEGFADTLAVNTLAPLAVSQAFLPHLRRSGSGRILTISSQMAWISAPVHRNCPCTSADDGSFGSASKVRWARSCALRATPKQYSGS